MKVKQRSPGCGVGRLLFRLLCLSCWSVRRMNAPFWPSLLLIFHLCLVGRVLAFTLWPLSLLCLLTSVLPLYRPTQDNHPPAAVNQHPTFTEKRPPKSV